MLKSVLENEALGNRDFETFTEIFLLQSTNVENVAYSVQPLNKDSQFFRDEVQGQAFHSDEANVVCQKLWATSL